MDFVTMLTIMYRIRIQLSVEVISQGGSSDKLVYCGGIRLFPLATLKTTNKPSEKQCTTNAQLIHWFFREPTGFSPFPRLPSSPHNRRLIGTKESIVADEYPARSSGSITSQLHYCPTPIRNLVPSFPSFQTGKSMGWICDTRITGRRTPLPR